MEKDFYISDGETLTGPFDTITMLRKVRSGAINGRTLITCDPAMPPVPACTYAELSTFLHQVESTQQEPTTPPSPFKLFASMLDNGWRMVSIEPLQCVMAGGILIVVFVLSFLLAGNVHNTALQAGAAFALFYLLQSIFMAISLRLHRGQRLSAQYLESALTPALLPLMLGSFIPALSILTGLTLLIFPGLLAMVYFSLVPMLIIDKRRPPLDAMIESCKLVWHSGYNQVCALLMLSGLYMISVALILPFPVLLPVYANALAEMYDRHTQRQ